MSDTQLYRDAQTCEFNPMSRSFVRHLSLPTLTTFDDERDALFITCALSLMPNLTKLEIGMGSYWTFRWCRPNSLCSLQELTITQGYVDQPPDCGAIRGLLEAAPALEKLKFNEVIHELHRGTTPYLSHTNVKELIFNASTLPTNNLKTLMNGFPSLETFYFGWDFMMIWAGIKGTRLVANVMTEIVMRRKRTIKHMSLDLSGLDSRGTQRLQDLSRMSLLETLHIHGSMLPGESVDEPGIALTVSEILPSSIKVFGIMGEAQKYLWEELLDLVTTSSVKHPHLKKVIVASGDLANEEGADWVKTFTSACNEHNIEFSMVEPKHWRALTRPMSHWTDDGKFKDHR
ncbi:hypothetical protein FPOAC1_005843 [Fusarium poae]|uniref:hypothetical protein n=1 Tax=Fusarium poae TaxID=36050 RepID=UPI001CE7A5E9|nr:hypothetical protein FPOAC1_005843 [Fusarium poae]KAG8672567.1 hypothetical protein FPOAC1_005843 [Fusarium poae]